MAKKRTKLIRKGDFGVGLVRCTIIKDKLHCSNLDEDKRTIVDEVRIESANVFWTKPKDFLSKNPTISLSRPVKCEVTERQDLNKRFLSCEDF